ncbi:hypothetical protein [Methanoculleus chikugoensis]|uniref:Uncharacterized protein n=1 Tax=Methanoculleus chikugoensis TaxID=118126 RepID=A0ABM7H5T5_9EURY|nr:hypothetical protein [Methanoculleus chikugoensis]BBL68058.1 hypothetical protein MchiMG62_12390 [Methanoculleus chikugoensis]
MGFLEYYLAWVIPIGVAFSVIRLLTYFISEQKTPHRLLYRQLLAFFLAGALVGAGIALFMLSQQLPLPDTVTQTERLGFSFGVSSIILALFAIALTIVYQSQSNDEELLEVNQFKGKQTEISQKLSDIENGLSLLTQSVHDQKENCTKNIELWKNLQDVNQNLQNIIQRLEQQNSLNSHILDEMKCLRCELHYNMQFAGINEKISTIEHKITQMERKNDEINDGDA